MMKKIILGLLLFVLCPHDLSPFSCAVLDVTGNNRIVMASFLDLLESVGMDPVYYPLSFLVDGDDVARVLSTQHQGVLIVLSNEICGALTTSPVAARLLEVIKACGQTKDFLLGLFFPCFTSIKNAGENALRFFTPLFDALHLPIPYEQVLQPPALPPAGVITNAQSEQAFFFGANRMLTRPITSRPLLYQTTLCLPHQGARFFTPELTALRERLHFQLEFLPRGVWASPAIAHLMPLFMYWHNKKVGNHLVISYANLTSFSGIVENFHLRPLNDDILTEFHQKMQRGLWQIKVAVDARKGIQGLPALPLQLPKSLEFGRPADENHKQPPQKIGWMEIAAFEEKDMPSSMSAHEKQQARRSWLRQQHELVAYIALSGLDNLWISINPNMMYSPIGKHASKLVRVEQSVARFTKKLARACQLLKKKVPRVLVGFEIANNLYAPNLPKNCSVDLYGGRYEDIPASLERSFWDQEVLRPLEKFVQLWQRPEVNNGVALSGVVIDLEMYCRKRTGTFFASMGFDRPTLEAFAAAQAGDDGQPLQLPQSVDEVAGLFMKHKLYGKFLDFLHDKAVGLGHVMVQRINRAMGSDAKIVCYAPSMVVDWFYNGLFAGLSSPDRPLGLLTFNVEFNRYQPWLQAHDIFAYHRGVVMLSKMQALPDTRLLIDEMRRSGGFWLNRFSRMAEKYEPTSWIGIEQTPMNQREKVALCRIAHALK